MKFICSLLIILVLCFGAFGQSRISVRVTVSSTSAIKAEAKESVIKKLRLIKDLDVVDGPSDFSIALVITETRLKDETLTGYAIAANFIQIIKCADKVYLDLQDSIVMTTGVKGIEESSKSIAEQFDTGVLSDYRKNKKG